MRSNIEEIDMKIFLLIIMMTVFSFGVTHAEQNMSQVKQGEEASIAIEGNLVKVNNKLCAVSRTPMSEESLGKFTGRVTYYGANQKFHGKIFEFNYCCAMCQKSFPKMFLVHSDRI